MPTYSYTCPSCNHQFDAFKRMADRKQHLCTCGEKADLVVGAVTFNLDPVSGDFPSRTRAWEKSHEKANWDDLKSLGLRESEKRIFT